MTTLTESTTTGSPSLIDNICHVVPDDAPDIALCGKDVSDRPFRKTAADEYCVVCLDLARGAYR